MPSKADLRARLLAARRARSADRLAADRAAIREIVLGRAAESGWGRVACYEPLRTEPGSVELLSGLHEPVVPVLLPDKDLSWREWPAGRDLGVTGVASADAVVVPALAVDHFGTRLGRGGGSYDRALARVPPGTPIVALLFDAEFVTYALPRDPWDVSVTAVVTPSGWRAVDGNRADLQNG